MKAFIKTLILFLVLVSLSMSCDSRGSQNIVSNPEVEIPKALTKTERAPDALSGFRSYRNRLNLVDDLYEEALEKNIELKNLDGRINSIFENRYDSLSIFENYKNINSSYWQSVRVSLSEINDSILSNQFSSLFDDYNSRYKGNLASYNDKNDIILQRDQVLKDQLLILKLITSFEAMENFQSSQLPKIEPLTNLIEDYDELIRECKLVNTLGE